MIDLAAIWMFAREHPFIFAAMLYLGICLLASLVVLLFGLLSSGRSGGGGTGYSTSSSYNPSSTTSKPDLGSKYAGRIERTVSTGRSQINRSSGGFLKDIRRTTRR